MNLFIYSDMTYSNHVSSKQMQFLTIQLTNPIQLSTNNGTLC